MVTITRPSRHEPSNLIRGPESMPAAEISPASVEVIEYEEELPGLFQEAAAGSPPARPENLLVLISRSLIAFYDSLSGPPMSERDRVLREIQESGRRSFPGLLSQQT